MEGIQGGTVNESLGVVDKHLLAVSKGIDDHGTGISKADLEDGMAVLAPPFLANCSMIIAELEKVACDRECAWDLWEVTDVGDVGASSDLDRISARSPRASRSTYLV